MKDEKVFIYGIVADGSVKYVGQTANVYKRYLKHRTNVNNCKSSPRLLYENLRAIGLESWDITALETTTRGLANERETYWIQNLKTAEVGWNVRNAGGGGREKGCTNPTGEDHYLYGKRVSRHIVEASVRARIGKKLSKEHIDKIRAGNARADRKDCKPLIREDGTEYYGVAEASRKNNVSRTAITQAIRKSGKCAGYRWKYKESPCQ